MREHILNEIIRLAAANDGQPPGMHRFEKETGIGTRDWLGVYWRRWDDALAEAGFQPQERGRANPDFVFANLVRPLLRNRKAPTSAQLQMLGRLQSWFADTVGLASIASPTTHDVPPHPDWIKGFVYLIRSGDRFKIDRRVKEFTMRLPEPVALVHAIGTDDPPGIETYWHQRLADRRENGDWFRLTPCDVAAFKRRKYQ